MPALTSVSSIAAAERNTSVRTMIATATPISSPTGAVCCSAWSTIWPLRSVAMPARSVIGATAASRSPGAFASSAAGWSYWTWVNAIRPSGETCPSASSGFAAAVTWGWPAIASTASAIAEARAGSRSVPSSTEKTTVAVSPARAGKRSASRSYASWDSVPGVVKLSEKPLPRELRRAREASATTTRARERFQ